MYRITIATIVAIVIIIAMFISIRSISTFNDTILLTPIPFVKIVRTNYCEDSDYVINKTNCVEIDCGFTSMDAENWELERCVEIE